MGKKTRLQADGSLAIAPATRKIGIFLEEKIKYWFGEKKVEGFSRIAGFEYEPAYILWAHFNLVYVKNDFIFRYNLL